MTFRTPRNLQNLLPLLFILTIASACGHKPDHPDDDSVPVVMKNFTLTEKTVIDSNQLTKARLLSGSELHALSVMKIDSSSMLIENGAKYHLLDTVFSAPSVKAVLVGREYEDENCVWLAIYDKGLKLIDKQLVFENNSEGSFSINSVVKDNAITVITFDQFEDDTKPVTKVIALSPANKFIQK